MSDELKIGVTERDPRQEPRIGDEIARSTPTAKQGMILRRVTRAHGGFVFCRCDNGYEAKPKILTLTKWRRWARTTEVVARAEEAQNG